MTVQPGGVGAQAPAPDVSVFVLTIPGLPGATAKIVFQEIVDIVSEIEVAQSAPTGAPAPGSGVTHTKQQMGPTLPPTVTLKRGLDGDTTLWQWHQLALDGAPNARQEVVLGMYTAADYAAGKPPVSTWNLTNAWCAKIAIVGAGAGAGAGNGVVGETVDIVCETLSLSKP
ncbi:phage tail-like protein [Catenulispora sp. GAS73]|uniref:phage tail protein n=1 Tax=Catenulispora sp. GAS73 TaxID=3156269 RepID=UPI0035150C08